MNRIHPGFTETPMTAPDVFADLNVTAGHPGANGSPVVVFLVSEEASYVNATEIAVDGGEADHGGLKAISYALQAMAATAGGRS